MSLGIVLDVAIGLAFTYLLMAIIVSGLVEVLAGWREELTGSSLPAAAADYVSFVGEALAVPVSIVGTGASRDAVLALQP